VVNSEHRSIEALRQKLTAKFIYGGAAEFPLTYYYQKTAKEMPD